MRRSWPGCCDTCIDNGIRRVILSVGYKHEVIQSYFGRSWQGLEIEYAVEDQPLGTGGALRLALERATEPAVLVLNGDTFIRLDYSGIEQALAARPDARLAVALRPVEDGRRYAVVKTEGGLIRGFEAGGAPGPALINAGVYCIRRDLFASYSGPEKFSFEKDFLEPAVEKLAPAAYVSEDPFIDIGIPEAYHAAQALIPEWLSLGSDLLWRDIRVGRSAVPVPALFLDRDGVIVEEKDHLGDPDEVEMLDGAAALILEARRRGMLVIEITNQAGIGYGMYGWGDFAKVENRIRAELAASGAALDAAFACPYHDKGSGVYRVADHPWRKPNPGMLLEAQRLLNIDLSRSVFVGDKVSDLEAARKAGIPRAVLVLTGHGKVHAEPARQIHGIGLEIVNGCGDVVL